MTLDQVFKSAAEGCQVPGCDCKTGEMVLASRCHPDAGSKVVVDVSKGTMRISCSVCDQTVMVINHTMSN